MTDSGQCQVGGRAGDTMHLVIVFEKKLSQVRAILPGDAGDQCARHGAQAVTLMRPSRWAFSSSMSASTISLTSSLKVVLGCQPSCLRALLASPTSKSTSVGRR